MRNLYIILLALCLGCEKPVKNHSIVRQQVESYVDTYAEREDWAKLLSFYSEDIQFEDLTMGLQLDGMEAFKDFYDWPDERFSKLTPDQKHMEVETMVVQDSIAVIKGHFNPFYWDGDLHDWKAEKRGQFTIWLFFNEKNKIIRQVDDISYPNSLICQEINSGS